MKAPWAAWTLVAQQPHPDSRERTVRAVRVTGPIEIDGRLDEAAWREAPAASGFTQVEPLEGLGALEETEVRILYDDENLYVGARMHDSDPGRIARQLTPRGVTGDAAGFFELSLDPNFDRTTGYTFGTTILQSTWSLPPHPITRSTPCVRRTDLMRQDRPAPWQLRLDQH